MHKVCLCGLLHSDICGSLYACYSPQLFAAYHVLRRLSMPRHSPYALCALPFELCASLFSIQNCYPTILIIKLVVFLICIYFSSLFNFQVPYTSSHIDSRLALVKCRKIRWIFPQCALFQVLKTYVSTNLLYISNTVSDVWKLIKFLRYCRFNCTVISFVGGLVSLLNHSLLR